MAARPSIALSIAIALTTAVVVPSQGQNPLTKVKKAIEKQLKPPKAAPPPQPGATAKPAQPVQAAQQAQPAQTLNAKVQETLMGPTVTGGLMSRTAMSEDGDHLAVVTANGSRQLVLVDGAEGPLFDEIPLNFAWSVRSRESGGSLVFSPTGGHSAYVARRAGDFIAVVDGREAATLATTATVNSGSPTGWAFMFNRDGSHLAYGAKSGTGWQMVFGGTPGPAFASIDFSQAFLKGNRLAYAAQTADQQWHAVVDGKPGPGYAAITSLQLTPDGAHYAYLASPPGAARAVAVVDGIVSKGADLGVFELELAPDGRFAYVAMTKAPPPNSDRGGEATLYVGGQATPAVCDCPTFSNRLPGGIAPPRRHLAWSPDGKGFAYIKSNRPAPGVTVIVNGKPMGPTYQIVSDLQWSPDGSRLAYVGTSPSGVFQVIDGQETEALNDGDEFQWSPDGKRYAFQGKSSLLVDGKEQPKVGYLLESFRFSSDSKHYAYASMAGNDRAIVDGEVKPFMLAGFQPTSQALPRINFPPLAFSPDGARLAFLGRAIDATGRATSQAGVIVDGVRTQGPSESYQFPTWSPDGKHFAVLVGNGQGRAPMIDGKVGTFYESVLENNVAACRFVDAHTLRIYGVKAGQIYRVTLDIS